MDFNIPKNILYCQCSVYCDKKTIITRSNTQALTYLIIYNHRMMKGRRNKFKKYKKSQDTNKKRKEVKQKEKEKYFVYACVQ